MAAAGYSTNLSDITLAQATTGFTAIGGGGAITAETDFYIQNGICLSKATSATWDSGGTPIGGVLFNAGTGLTIPTDGAVLTWIYWWGPGVLATKANGGAEICIGNSTTAYKTWYVTGSDNWEFGGWRNYPVNPSVTASRTVGAPNTTLQYFGWQANVAAAASIGKGNPYGIDAIRYGRCDLISTAGDLANGYATFDGAALWDNDPTRRLGLLTPMNGVYQMQGLFQMGTAATAVDFRDSNRVIFIQNTEKVSANFNTIEVKHASSNIDWTSISISALGTVSKGRFVTTDNATVSLDTCTFTDMGTFGFLSNASISGTTFRRCGQVTAGGATMTSSTFETSSDSTGALLLTSDTQSSSLSDLNFVNNAKAIKITTAGTYSFIGHQFTGNTVQVDFTGTGTCTINPSNGCNVSQANVTASGGGTITVNTPSVNLTFTGVINDSEIRVVRVSDTTILDGVESVTGGQWTYSHTLGGTVVDIYILHVDYQWYPIRNFTLPSANASVPISQIKDRQYARGTTYAPG